MRKTNKPQGPRVVSSQDDNRPFVLTNDEELIVRQLRALKGSATTVVYAFVHQMSKDNFWKPAPVKPSLRIVKGGAQ